MDFATQLDQLPSPKLTPSEKLRMALALYDEGVALQRLTLRRRHPDATEGAIEKMIESWLAREVLDATR